MAEEDEISNSEAVTGEKCSVFSTLSKLSSNLFVEFSEVFDGCRLFLFRLVFAKPASVSFRGPEVERGLNGPIDKVSFI